MRRGGESNPCMEVLSKNLLLFFEARVGFEPAHGCFANSCVNRFTIAPKKAYKFWIPRWGHPPALCACLASELSHSRGFRSLRHRAASNAAGTFDVPPNYFSKCTTKRHKKSNSKMVI